MDGRTDGRVTDGETATSALHHPPDLKNPVRFDLINRLVGSSIGNDRPKMDPPRIGARGKGENIALNLFHFFGRRSVNRNSEAC